MCEISIIIWNKTRIEKIKFFNLPSPKLTVIDRSYFVAWKNSPSPRKVACSWNARSKLVWPLLFPTNIELGRHILSWISAFCLFLVALAMFKIISSCSCIEFSDKRSVVWFEMCSTFDRANNYLLSSPSLWRARPTLGLINTKTDRLALTCESFKVFEKFLPAWW